jgi:hypothetical protein
MSEIKCNNCCQPHTEFTDVCILESLLGVSVLGRESLTMEQARSILIETDVYALWNDLGPIIDRLEDGKYAI